ncbi:calmodulin-like [Teleopsis dalmanni]|uniref:calmodulin-like n=1 Tax=Teleopsis dalmanni TaxID=139649 RepID=UPI0018CDAE4D|nr:calmodulin-like [Teleopsis dalmanni]
MAYERSNLTQHEMEKIQMVFAQFDKDSDGRLTELEFNTSMYVLGENLSHEELRSILNSFDKSGEGFIDIDQFILIMEQRKRDNESLLEIEKAFKLFDKDNNGFISMPELKRGMTSIGVYYTEGELCDMLYAADTDKNGKIDFLEFAEKIMPVIRSVRNSANSLKNLK